MYAALFMIITSVLVTALYAELHDIFGATNGNAQALQRVRVPKRRSGR
jgi:hypothetical protein